jgi:hypothetical protein
MLLFSPVALCDLPISSGLTPSYSRRFYASISQSRQQRPSGRCRFRVTCQELQSAPGREVGCGANIERGWGFVGDVVHVTRARPIAASTGKSTSTSHDTADPRSDLRSLKYRKQLTNFGEPEQLTCVWWHSARPLRASCKFTACGQPFDALHAVSCQNWKRLDSRIRDYPLSLPIVFVYPYRRSQA